MTKLVAAVCLSLGLLACATEAPTVPEPSQAAIDYASHLASCDPGLEADIAAVTSGQSQAEPIPSPKCQAESLAAEGGCHFVSWWNWAGFSERAACVGLGLPLCYATICVAGWIDS
jgi:hypothetical protein